MLRRALLSPALLLPPEEEPKRGGESVYTCHPAEKAKKRSLGLRLFYRRMRHFLLGGGGEWAVVRQGGEMGVGGEDVPSSYGGA